jgi:hypothetical protein
MTEKDWIECDDPQPMLALLRSQASDRQLRLFAVACCRTIWPIVEAPIRDAVEAAEAYADGMASRVELQAARFLALNTRGAGADAAGEATLLVAMNAAAKTIWSVVRAHGFIGFRQNGWHTADWHAAQQAGRETLARLLRDIFGNPFRPVALDPSWLTFTVVGLAQTIYDGRAFDLMPILGDALEDAGCTNVDMLNHCRQGSEHVRGCRLVDLLLEKA